MQRKDVTIKFDARTCDELLSAVAAANGKAWAEVHNISNKAHEADRQGDTQQARSLSTQAALYHRDATALSQFYGLLTATYDREEDPG